MHDFVTSQAGAWIICTAMVCGTFLIVYFSKK